MSFSFSDRQFSAASTVPQHLQQGIDEFPTQAHHDSCAQESHNDNTNKLYTFSMDVPVTEADVGRWETLLHQSAPPPEAPNSAFVGGGFLDTAAVLAMNNEDERQRATHKLTPMKLFQPQMVIRMPMTKVLTHRRNWLPYRHRVPLYQYRAPFLDALLRNQVLALVASPGSGCTLQIPQIMSETEVFKGKRIIVVCPTNLAACRTTDRLREERGEDAASRTVAVCTPTQYEVEERTLIAVTTPDMLVRQLLCDPLLLRVCCVILNDIHLRSPVLELSMSLLRGTLRLLKDKHDVEKRGGDLRIVVGCLEDTIAATIAEFFGEECTTRLNLMHVMQQGLADAHNLKSNWVTPCVLHLEETIQWLTKCEEEGSFLCRDTAEDLRHFVENIGVVAKIMAAEDANFANDEKFLSYWCPIILRAVHEYDRSERKESEVASAAMQPRPAVVVVAPNAHVATLICKALRCEASVSTKSEDEEQKQTNEEVGKKEAGIQKRLPLTVRLLPEDVTSEQLQSSLLQDDNAAVESFAGGNRLVFVTTPIMAQSVLPSTLDVGLVVDCARRSYVSYDANTDADVFVTAYSHVQELRYRRTIARIRRGNIESEKKGEWTPGCMVVQLIPKSVLHSVQHRRVSGDPAQHTIFHMSWDEYVGMYHLLQAREEGLRCRIFSAGTAAETGNSHILSTMVAQLVSSNFVGVPPASTSRYEQLRRTFVMVEHYLQRLGHLESINTQMPPKLSPFGVATTCFALPLAVVRLLLLSQLNGCVIPASLVAATWMNGSMFLVDEADPETKQLIREARVFFSRDSGSDVITAFHAYRMWLSLRETSEAEEAFLKESHIPRETLIRIEALQLCLFRLLEVTGVSYLSSSMGHPCCKGDAASTDNIPTSAVASASSLAFSILQIPDDDILIEGHILMRCVTAAAYPRCAIPHNNGMVTLVGLPCNVTKGATTTDSTGVVSRASQQIAIFSGESVMSVEEVYKQYVEKPFVYLHRKRIVEKGIYTLDGAVPLCMDAAVVVCGEQREWPKVPASRCRGWTSVMTCAWRQTKRARRLPPPAQLPAVSISLRPYDTIRATPVILQVDDLFSFSMRSTTAKWLQLMRKQTRLRLRALLCDKSWPPTGDVLLALQEMWDWWLRRARNAQDWLREERASRLAMGASENRREDDNCVFSLCPYYQYSTNPGRPKAVVPSKRQVGIGSAANAVTMAASATGRGVGSGAAATSDIVARQSTAYMGKMPDPVMDKNIQHSARSIAKARSREQEATFLKMYPDLFAFLNPEHEFHAYYLHVLRREAPDLEVLGDDLEELERFLTELEEEVQREVGATAMTDAVSCGSQFFGDGPVAGDSGAKAQYQFQEVNEEEYMASYGMQVETAAEHTKRPPTLFKTQNSRVSSSSGVENSGGVPSAASFFSPQGGVLDGPAASPAVTYTPVEKSTPKTSSVDVNVSIGNFTFDKGSGTAQGVPTAVDSSFASDVIKNSGGSNVGGSAPTLMERLLAMKEEVAGQQNHSEAAPLSGNKQESLQLQLSDQSAPSAVGAAMWPHNSNNAVAPNPSAVLHSNNLNNNGGGSGSGAGGISETISQQTTAAANTTSYVPPTTTELLALMGIIPSVPAANPLTTPPPPLPTEAVANRPPSILVYPLPPREFGNIPLILAKALGETMCVKVGPTHIVGNVARIGVPNHMVEARALELKSFTCVGRKVHIFKNDRIVDSVRQVASKVQQAKSKQRDDVSQHPNKVGCGSELQKGEERGGQRRLHHEMYGAHASIQYDEDRKQDTEQSWKQQEQWPLFDSVVSSNKTLGHLPHIGLLTDDEDDDDDDDEDVKNDDSDGSSIKHNPGSDEDNQRSSSSSKSV